MSSAAAVAMCSPSPVNAAPLPAVSDPTDSADGLRIGKAKYFTSGWTVALAENTTDDLVVLTAVATYHDKKGREVSDRYQFVDVLPPGHVDSRGPRTCTFTLEPTKAKGVKSAQITIASVERHTTQPPTSNITMSKPSLLVGSKSAVGTTITNDADETWSIGVHAVVLRGDRIVAWGGNGNVPLEAGETRSAAMPVDGQVRPGDVAYVTVIERNAKPDSAES